MVKIKKIVAPLILINLICLSMPYTYGKNKENTSFSSGENKVHLLELFSTQSCSSCPPAQVQVSKLKNNTKIWTHFVPIVWHVDYWDHLGWKDPFSNPKYTKRQRAYSSKWGTRNIYTPMFVLNGKDEKKRKSILTKVLELKSKAKPGNLTIKQTKKNTFTVEFESLQKLEKLKIHGAIIGSGIETKVTRGENSGSTLKHDFLVLESKSSLLSKKGKKHIGKITFPPYSSKKIKKEWEKRVVFWITQKNSLEPIQVASGSL